MEVVSRLSLSYDVVYRPSVDSGNQWILSDVPGNQNFGLYGRLS